jgi:hypothetical protein
MITMRSMTIPPTTRAMRRKAKFEIGITEGDAERRCISKVTKICGTLYLQIGLSHVIALKFAESE